MKKFKHKKTGNIVVQVGLGIYAGSRISCFSLPAWIIENSNDWIELINPLFLTDDLIPIYEGGECWYVNHEFEVKHWKNIKQYRSGVEGYHYFSTEKLANNYSERNKLQFSISDIQAELSKYFFSTAFVSIVCENLKETKKSK